MRIVYRGGSIVKVRKTPSTSILFISLFVCAQAVSGDGLPGEYLATQRWRDLLSSRSPLGNPSLLAEENYTTFRGAMSNSMQGFSQMWELGFTLPIGLYHTAGLTWFGLNTGSVQQAVLGDDQLLTGKESTDDRSNAFLASYAINPWRRLNLGVNVLVLRQDNFGDPLMGFGAGAGLSWNLMYHPILGNHVIGAALQNLAPPTLEGEDRTEKLPTNLKLSWMGSVVEGLVEAELDYALKDIFASADEFAEVTYTESDSGILQSLSKGTKSLEYDINFRAGVWPLRDLAGAFFQIGTGYVGFSIALNGAVLTQGRDLWLMYQYMNMTGDDLASHHTFYLVSEVGLHREEMYARRMSRLASIMPNDLYARAMRLFTSGKYWDAYFVFGQLESKFPDFFKNDWVGYYRGRCLESLDMRARALATYSSMLDEYPRSKAIPQARLGMMRVHYLETDHSDVRRVWGELNNGSVHDSLRMHAAYLMAQTFMKENEYHKAVGLFNHITDRHPDYVYAQHSAGVCHVLNVNLGQAMVSFENCLQVKTSTPAQEEVVNRSLVFLGYLFYEENSLSKAVTALRMVDTRSSYYEDAQLGLGWSALKARQWRDCIRAGEILARKATRLPNQAEGYLIKSYGHIMQKQHEDAAAALVQAQTVLRSYSAPDRDSLSRRTREYERNRISYDFIAQKAQRFSHTNQTPVVAKIADSLHTEQQKLRTDLEDYLGFNDEFTRRSFFDRGIERIRNDVEYAYAVVNKMVKQGSEMETLKDAREKQESIDTEIEKLKKQMRELENGE